MANTLSVRGPETKPRRRYLRGAAWNLAFDEVERSGVHAVTQACGTWAIVEDVAKVRIALGTLYFRTRHAKTSVHRGFNIFLRDRRPEARPTGTGLKLRIGREQGVSAAHATIQAMLVIVPVLPGKGPLRSSMPGDLELLRRQLFFPLTIALMNLFHFHHSLTLARVSKINKFHHAAGESENGSRTQSGVRRSGRQQAVLKKQSAFHALLF